MKKAAKKPTKVLFCAFEAEPFVKTGGLGDVAGSLPIYAKNEDYDVRVILPKLSAIPEQFRAAMQPVTSFEVELSWRRQYCGLLSLEHRGVTFYFLDNEYYFKRANDYGEYDDGERIAFFSKAILEAIRHMPGFTPDILHCNDWHTALTPIYLREQYMGCPGFDKIKTIFTVHNLKFQGIYPGSMLGDVLGLHNCPAAAQLMYGDWVNYMQGALRYSDRLTTVSPTYAQEICTPWFGEGMDWLFSQRKNVLSGILNGIDYEKYDPMTDPAAGVPFDAEHLEQKRRNKEQLQAELGLPVGADIPMFTVISRLTDQKGCDLITYDLPELMRRRMQLVILGVGFHRYEEAFTWYAAQYPEHTAALIKFDEPLSRRLYACSDVLLMPSQFEPCGLAQMMAMRYGTLPLVRETGGLRDSVQPYNQYSGEGTGFSFANFNAHEMLGTIDLALDTWYNRPADWEKLQKNAMAQDFSWRASAEKYRSLWKETLEG